MWRNNSIDKLWQIRVRLTSSMGIKSGTLKVSSHNGSEQKQTRSTCCGPATSWAHCTSSPTAGQDVYLSNCSIIKCRFYRATCGAEILVFC
jgi:hypothetical protein